MFIAGVNHFVMPRVYESIVPEALPARRGLVYASGVAEIVGALATMYGPTRRAGGWILIATLLVVFPANVNMAMNAEDYPDVPGGTAALIARLPLQALFLYLVYKATLENPERPSAPRKVGPPAK